MPAGPYPKRRAAAAARLEGLWGGGKSAPLTAQEQAERAALEAMPEGAIETREMPEVKDWSSAERGRFSRPVKRQITLRLDADVSDFFERAGKGCQTRVNEALRACVERHRE
jgi:uncharacterized protein (DUF4415 family)